MRKKLQNTPDATTRSAARFSKKTLHFSFEKFSSVDPKYAKNFEFHVFFTENFCTIFVQLPCIK